MLGKPVDFNKIADLYQPVQVRAESLWLIEKIKLLEPRNIAVEIGVFKGGSFYIFMKLFEKVIGIDIVKKEFPYKLRENDQYIIGDSKNPEIIAQISNEIDFLFIDGDHSYKGVSGDFYLWKPKIRKDGLIALHDINGVNEGNYRSMEVMKFWNEIKGSYNTEEVILHEKYYGIGLIKL